MMQLFFIFSNKFSIIFWLLEPRLFITLTFFETSGLPPGRETSGRLLVQVEPVLERRQLGRLHRLDHLAHRCHQEQHRTSSISSREVRSLTTDWSMLNSFLNFSHSMVLESAFQRHHTDFRDRSIVLKKLFG